MPRPLRSKPQHVLGALQTCQEEVGVPSMGSEELSICREESGVRSLEILRGD